MQAAVMPKSPQAYRHFNHWPLLWTTSSVKRVRINTAMLYGMSFQIVLTIKPLAGERANKVQVNQVTQRGAPHCRIRMSVIPATMLSTAICTRATIVGESQSRVISQFVKV